MPSSHTSDIDEEWVWLEANLEVLKSQLDESSLDFSEIVNRIDHDFPSGPQLPRLRTVRELALMGAVVMDMNLEHFSEIKDNRFLSIPSKTALARAAAPPDVILQKDNQQQFDAGIFNGLDTWFRIMQEVINVYMVRHDEQLALSKLHLMAEYAGLLAWQSNLPGLHPAELHDVIGPRRGELSEEKWAEQLPHDHWFRQPNCAAKADFTSALTKYNPKSPKPLGTAALNVMLKVSAGIEQCQVPNRNGTFSQVCPNPCMIAARIASSEADLRSNRVAPMRLRVAAAKKFGRLPIIKARHESTVGHHPMVPSEADVEAIWTDSMQEIKKYLRGANRRLNNSMPDRIFDFQPLGRERFPGLGALFGFIAGSPQPLAPTAILQNISRELESELELADREVFSRDFANRRPDFPSIEMPDFASTGMSAEDPSVSDTQPTPPAEQQYQRPQGARVPPQRLQMPELSSKFENTTTTPEIERQFERNKQYAASMLSLTGSVTPSAREEAAITLISCVKFFLDSQRDFAYTEDFEVWAWSSKFLAEIDAETTVGGRRYFAPDSVVHRIATATTTYFPEQRAAIDALLNEDTQGVRALINRVFNEGPTDTLTATPMSDSHGRNLQEIPPLPGTIENLLAQLHELIGLDAAKSQILGAVDLARLTHVQREEGLTVHTPTMHMVFSGNPGTGKTTVARLDASIFHAAGLLRIGHMIEVDRSSLVGVHLGSSVRRAAQALDRARGGVLLVDEAYSLIADDRDLFGFEVLNAIVKSMEDYADDLLVIFTGYPDKLSQLLDQNEGLRSRFPTTVAFADYSCDELLEITNFMAASGQLSLPQDYADLLKDFYRDQMARPDFGNARFVRNFLDDVKRQQARRLAPQISAKQSLSQQQLSEITALDLSAAMALHSTAQPHQVGADDLLAEQLLARVFGQEEAVRAVAHEVALSRANLDIHPQRPNGVFLLAGPTGTGKTELARSLAEALHGSEESMIRLNMSEFAYDGAVQALIGVGGTHAKAGRGSLTKALAKRPNTVLLLDEFEKANPDVWNLFLQVFDDGEISDGNGHKYNLSNCTVIVTSSVGALAWKQTEPVGFDHTEPTDEYRQQSVLKELRTFFGPELLGRFDKILIFRPLSTEVQRSIVEKTLADWTRQLERNGWQITFSDDVAALVMQRCVDQGFGARSVEQATKDLISPLLLDNAVGSYLIYVDDDHAVAIQR